jgi:hypothetical protein
MITIWIESINSLLVLSAIYPGTTKFFNAFDTERISYLAIPSAAGLD